MRPKESIGFAVLLAVLVVIAYLWYGCETEEVKDSSEGMRVAAAPGRIHTLGADGMRHTFICRVYDSSTKEFLENCTATFTSPEGDVEMYQSPTGEFEIRDVPPGMCRIKVSKEGFTELLKCVETVPKQYEDCASYCLTTFYLTRICAPQTIGPDGGEISPDDFTKIEIPTGALRDQFDISVTPVPRIGMPQLPDSEPGLHILGGVDLRPSGLRADSPMTLSLLIDGGSLSDEATIWLYSFDPINEKWVDPIAAQLTETRVQAWRVEPDGDIQQHTEIRTQATVQIGHFSMVAWVTDHRWLRTGVDLIRSGVRPPLTEWSDLITSDCGEPAIGSITNLFVEYEGNPEYESAAREAVEDMISPGAIYPFPYSSPLQCDAISGSKATITYGITYGIYDVVKYSSSGSSAVVGNILVPESVQSRCRYKVCHDQGILTVE